MPLLLAAGAAAVTVHGRTGEQRYKKSADWDLISKLASPANDLVDLDTGSALGGAGAGAGVHQGGLAGLSVIGNGDVLTHYEARRRLDESGCLAVMVGRGALVRPWLWQELKEGRELDPTASERVGELQPQLALRCAARPVAPARQPLRPVR